MFSLPTTALDALLVINHIGEQVPLVAGEFVGPPIVADMASSVEKETESRSVDAVFDAAGELSSDQQKLVDATADDWVDVALIDLLAEAPDSDESDESEDSASMLIDLAILDLQ